MSDTQTIPCIDLPNLPPLKISLPFGVELNAMADFSKGPPTNCALVQSLLVQLAPALAGMECIFKMLNVVLALSKMKDVKLPTDVVSGIVNVAEAAAALSDCFLFPLQIVCMVVDILKVIISFLLCIIESVESLLKFQLSINLDAAAGNPVVLASLTCAQNNLAATSAQIGQSLKLIAPLLAIIQSLLGLAPSIPGPIGQVMGTIPKAIATISSVLAGGASVSVPGAAGPLEILEDVRRTLAELQALLNDVPC